MAKKQKTKNLTTKKHLSRERREAKQSKIILAIAISTGVIILGLVFYGLINQFIIHPQSTIATVGETRIKAGEFESFVQYTRAQSLNQALQYYNLQQQFGSLGGDFLQPAISIVSQLIQPIPFARDVLDEMINNVIIGEEAAKLAISVSQEEIDQAIYSAFGFFPDGTLTPTVTATIMPSPTFSETQLAIITLTSTPTQIAEETDDQQIAGENSDFGQTSEDLSANGDEGLTGITSENIVATNNAGSSAAIEPTPTITVTPTPYTTQVFARNVKDFNKAYRPYGFDYEQLRMIFKYQLLREKLTANIGQDVPRTKDEVWARHILVETEEEALEVLDRLENGEDFHALAELYSLDESNKEKGGDLGWFDDKTMVPSFSIAAFSLAEGEISEPIESSFGFHIIQVIGKRVSQISAAELQQLKQDAFDTWLSGIRAARNDIEINPNWEKYAPTKPEVPQQFVSELFSQGQ